MVTQFNTLGLWVRIDSQWTVVSKSKTFTDVRRAYPHLWNLRDLTPHTKQVGHNQAILVTEKQQQVAMPDNEQMNNWYRRSQDL